MLMKRGQKSEMERIRSRVSKRLLHTHVHRRAIHNSQDVAATQVSMGGWMDGWMDGWIDKQNMVHPLSGIWQP